mmetsp:Transcript_2469/g.6451  ORF Transcript_2469/g.6451 Transcript_2469/m.6451 type:complete len:182 (-) Transcript_2469:159-704(-)
MLGDDESCENDDPAPNAANVPWLPLSEDRALLRTNEQLDAFARDFVTEPTLSTWPLQQPYLVPYGDIGAMLTVMVTKRKQVKGGGGEVFIELDVRIFCAALIDLESVSGTPFTLLGSAAYRGIDEDGALEPSYRILVRRPNGDDFTIDIPRASSGDARQLKSLLCSHGIDIQSDKFNGATA